LENGGDNSGGGLGDNNGDEYHELIVLRKIFFPFSRG